MELVHKFGHALGINNEWAQMAAAAASTILAAVVVVAVIMAVVNDM